MVNQKLYNLLCQWGVTIPLDNIPSIFKIGCGIDSESTTIKHIEEVKRGKSYVKKCVVDTCFNYVWQWAFLPDNAETTRTKSGIIQTILDIVDTVKEYNKIHDTNAIFIIWFANAAHEWAFVKGAIAKQFEVTKLFAKTQRDMLYLQIENCVELRECVGLFGHSLDDIAKNWCSKNNQKLKGQYDYDKIRTWQTPLSPETEVPYIHHDVTTLAEMHINVVKQYTQENGVCRLPYTSSGFVRMALKDNIRNDEELTELRNIYNERHTKKPLETNIEYLKKVNEKCVVNEFQWSICREFSYSGGLCGSNIKLASKILNNVVCADLTSDYPAQLTHRLYPYGSLKEITSGDLNDIRRYYDDTHKPYFAILKIKRLHAKTQHATFSEHKIINKTNKYFTIHGEPKNLVVYNGKVHHAENIIVCWNDVDIAAYKKLYDIKATVLTLWVFDSYKKLPEWFLKTLWNGYRRKAELKNAGLSNTIEYTDAKRIPNSIYGVCAQKDEDTYTQLATDLNFMIKKHKTFKELKRNFWLNPYIAFWCTSYARSILMHFLSEYPNQIIQYDTDSLYYLQKGGDELEKTLLKYNDDILMKNRRIFRNEDNPTLFETLGQWDFDDVYVKFMGMGAKKYIKQDKDGKIHTVIAGLPKGAIPKEIEEKGIKSPFDYYNPLIKYMQTNTNKIIVNHVYAHKFASVYCDDIETHYETITDYQGNTALQEVSSYHAIIPIDYTLTMSKDYILEIIKNRAAK